MSYSTRRVAAAALVLLLGACTSDSPSGPNAAGAPTRTTSTPSTEAATSPSDGPTLGPSATVAPTTVRPREAKSPTSPSSGTSETKPSPSPSAARVQYSVRISPDRPTVDQEVRISVTAPHYTSPRIERIDFGDGTPPYTCTYSPASGHSENCEGYGEPGTQYCYHIYQRPGRYTVRVMGTPGEIASGYGEVTFEVVDSSVPATPTLFRPRPAC